MFKFDNFLYTFLKLTFDLNQPPFQYLITYHLSLQHLGSISPNFFDKRKDAGTQILAKNSPINFTIVLPQKFMTENSRKFAKRCAPFAS